MIYKILLIKGFEENKTKCVENGHNKIEISRKNKEMNQAFQIYRTSLDLVYFLAVPFKILLIAANSKQKWLRFCVLELSELNYYTKKQMRHPVKTQLDLNHPVKFNLPNISEAIALKKKCRKWPGPNSSSSESSESSESTSEYSESLSESSRSGNSSLESSDSALSEDWSESISFKYCWTFFNELLS